MNNIRANRSKHGPSRAIHNKIYNPEEIQRCVGITQNNATCSDECEVSRMTLKYQSRGTRSLLDDIN